ncbi:dopamine receptor 1-like [Littorina saxatilis]|uniref:dopamine receptor 1-like n=1 Tax=Littorina saxatilis TaxID=31220 RepID=UPI0038B5FC2B
MPPWQTEEKSTVEKVLIIIILSFIIVTAAVGNLLVFIAVVIDRSLHRDTYFLIASLAVADLLCAVLSMPFAVHIALYGQWVFGAVYCRIWIASDVVLCFASILHLCPIALDRYLWSFMVCWVPFFSANFAEAVNETDISSLTFVVLTWLGYANSCINPVVYGFYTKPFRRAFRRMFGLIGFYDESGQRRVSRFITDRRFLTATLNRSKVAEILLEYLAAVKEV